MDMPKTRDFKTLFQTEVANAIEAMDAKIAAGWRYNWFRSYSKVDKMCCLAGAYMDGTPSSVSTHPLSRIAQEFHINQSVTGDGGFVLRNPTWQDWPSLRAHLVDTYLKD